MYIAILGRQPKLSIAELESIFGDRSISLLSDKAAQIESKDFEIRQLGSIPKAGKFVFKLSNENWDKLSKKIVQHYLDVWSKFSGKITLGISLYGLNVSAKDVQKTGVILKKELKKSDVSLRLIPNLEPALNTATSHHNKLGLSPNKIELLIVRADNDDILIAESTGSQNISAYAKRDQNRPKRDMFVGMLPPKLAQIMINLSCGLVVDSKWYMVNGTKSQTTDAKSTLPSTAYHLPSTILDPFCGTGVILQEASLMGYSVYGTDLSEKMVRYSRDNLNWLANSHHVHFDWYLHEGDAMNTKWRQPIDAIVSETYLGQPFSAPPSSPKLEEVKQNCNHITTEFLKNLSSQIKPGTPVCIAIPAWRDKNDCFIHLPLIKDIEKLGYRLHKFKNISQNDLIYCRENQTVAREILVLKKSS